MHPFHHAQTTPDKAAYIMADTGETVTYRQLDDRSNQVAQMLRAAGLAAGDHMAIILENHPRFFELCWGAQRAGIIYTAVSTRLTVGEAAYIVQDCGAKMLVISHALAELAQALVAATQGVGTRLMLDGCIAGYQSYEAALATYPAQRIADETAGGDMLYSSGTTGRPKGVFAPPESPQIDASNSLIEVCKNIYGINGQSIYLSPAPLYHAAPLRFNLVAMRLGSQPNRIRTVWPSAATATRRCAWPIVSAASRCQHWRGDWACRCRGSAG